MAKIQGISILLYKKEAVGKDPFGAAIYEERPVTVENVLVYPLSASEMAEELRLSGRKIAYTLCIPKGDRNDWENTEVEFFGKRFRTVGIPEEFIEGLLPLAWNKKVKVERYG